MVGIYLSGTGNTKHCLEKLLSVIDPKAEMIPIENHDAVGKIVDNDEIILAYPTQFSNVPYMVKDFIQKNEKLWDGKKVFCVTTMGAFSGDGAGCSARLLKKYGAKILGGLQVKMPDSVCDSKMLKKPFSVNQELLRKADEKIEQVGIKIRNDGTYPREGLSIFAHMAGLFGQRLWFYGKTKNYSKNLKINDSCIGCGLCARKCPMQNISITDGRAHAKDQCAMCYRCISLCPQKAITLLGKEVVEQTRYEKFACKKNT